MNLSRDIHPLTDFKRHTPSFSASSRTQAVLSC